MQVRSLGQGRFPLGKGMATYFSTLAWEYHGQKSLVGCSPLVANGKAWLSKLTYVSNIGLMAAMTSLTQRCCGPRKSPSCITCASPDSPTRSASVYLMPCTVRFAGDGRPQVTYNQTWIQVRGVQETGRTDVFMGAKGAVWCFSDSPNWSPLPPPLPAPPQRASAAKQTDLR